MFLSCADPLGRRRPDPHFAREVAAARDAGATVGLIDHDALLRGDVAEAVRGVGSVGADAADEIVAWYRGWMIPSARYAQLSEALAGRGVRLATTPEQFARAHELPGWYDAMRAYTPVSAWIESAPGELPENARLQELAARVIGPGRAGIVKDFVKSAKHRWLEACYIPDLGDAAALRRVVSAFVLEQDEFLAGGLVVREFEDFEGSQLRVWWLDGRAVLVGPHPDTPDEVPDVAQGPDLGGFAGAVGDLACRFVTTDLVRRRPDGRWRVVEVGDGQVSDLPSTVEAADLVGLLVRAEAETP